VRILLIAALVCVSPIVIGQTTLGALLDAGARKLTPEEFRTELTQRLLVGPTGASLGIEVMYTSEGRITGMSTQTYGPGGTLNGDWRTDNEGRVCSSMQIDSSRMANYNLAPRCQFWFKLGDTYYVADSDSDRYMKILPRKLK